jgi:hypothetical protein
MVRWEGQYSDQLLETIDWCLCLNHRYRPQSVFALQKALTEAVVAPTPSAPSQKDTCWAGRRQIEEDQGRMKFTIYQESPGPASVPTTKTGWPTAIRAKPC